MYNFQFLTGLISWFLSASLDTSRTSIVHKNSSIVSALNMDLPNALILLVTVRTIFAGSIVEGRFFRVVFFGMYCCRWIVAGGLLRGGLLQVDCCRWIAAS